MKIFELDDVTYRYSMTYFNMLDYEEIEVLFKFIEIYHQYIFKMKKELNTEKDILKLYNSLVENNELNYFKIDHIKNDYYVIKYIPKKINKGEV